MLIFLSIADNGFNPQWKEMCEFSIANPDFALLRFLVQDEDVFGEPNFIGQATYPVRKLYLHFINTITNSLLKFV